MSHCPAIEALEELLARDDKKTIKHAQTCVACQAVLQLLVDRDDRENDPGARGCAELEILAARRQVSALSDADERALVSHVQSCEPCKLLLEDELD